MGTYDEDVSLLLMEMNMRGCDEVMARCISPCKYIAGSDVCFLRQKFQQLHNDFSPF